MSNTPPPLLVDGPCDSTFSIMQNKTTNRFQQSLENEEASQVRLEDAKFSLA